MKTCTKEPYIFIQYPKVTLYHDRSKLSLSQHFGTLDTASAVRSNNSTRICMLFQILFSLSYLNKYLTSMSCKFTCIISRTCKIYVIRHTCTCSSCIRHASSTNYNKILILELKGGVYPLLQTYISQTTHRKTLYLSYQK